MKGRRRRGGRALQLPDMTPLCVPTNKQHWQPPQTGAGEEDMDAEMEKRHNKRHGDKHGGQYRE
jgi:hypothetical protein